MDTPISRTVASYALVGLIVASSLVSLYRGQPLDVSGLITLLCGLAGVNAAPAVVTKLLHRSSESKGK